MTNKTANRLGHMIVFIVKITIIIIIIRKTTDIAVTGPFLGHDYEFA